MLARAFDRKGSARKGRRIPAAIHSLKSAGGGKLMVTIRSEHLEVLEAIITTALNIVKTRPAGGPLRPQGLHGRVPYQGPA